MRDKLEEYEAPRVTDLEDAGRLDLGPLDYNGCSSGTGPGNDCSGGN
jgi:hypothetical protein